MTLPCRPIAYGRILSEGAKGGNIPIHLRHENRPFIPVAEGQGPSGRSR